MSPRELMEQLAIDHCYFVYTNGGVTFGGGEPLLHSAQIKAFAELCPREWNITLETSLNVPFGLLQPLLTERFSFIIDVKAMQPDIYLNYTGVENQQVIENLTLLHRLIPEKQYVIKLPSIPGYSDRRETEESLEVLQALGIPAGNIAGFRYVTPLPE